MIFERILKMDTDTRFIFKQIYIDIWTDKQTDRWIDTETGY